MDDDRVPLPRLGARQDHHLPAVAGAVVELGPRAGVRAGRFREASLEGAAKIATIGGKISLEMTFKRR